MLHLAISIVVLGLITFARLSDPTSLRSLREMVFDGWQQLAPREAIDSGIRIVVVDEKSIEKFGQWPWPRSIMASMVNRLNSLGSAVVAFDMVFSEPDRTGPNALLDELKRRGQGNSQELETLLRGIKDNDALFGTAISQSNAVLGFFPTVEQTGQKSVFKPFSTIPKGGISYAGDIDPVKLLPNWPAAITNLPLLSDSATGVGSLSLGDSNVGDRIRKVPLLFSDGTQFFPNLALEALRVAVQSPSFTVITSTASTQRSVFAADINHFVSVRISNTDYVIPVDGNGDMRLYYSDIQNKRFISASDLFALGDEALRPLIEGQIVFVGASAIGLRDIRTTSLGQRIPGVAIHAQIAEQILTNSYLHRPDWARGLEIFLSFVITIVLVAALPRLGAMGASIFGMILAGLVVLGCYWAFVSQHILLDALYPLATALAVFLVSLLFMFAVSERDKRFVRAVFGQYVAPDVLRQIENSPEKLKLGGETREITIMFMDIRGFTPISEKLEPEQLVTFLNQLLTPLSEIVMKHEGVIDKYIGDCIMAFWNAPLDVDNHQEKALCAGLEMIAKVKQLNEEDAFGFKGNNADFGSSLDSGQGSSQGNVEIGIGINSGSAIVGNMGSTKRFDYSVIGDAVNTAARIEASCKKVGWPLLASAHTIGNANQIVALEGGGIALKGKQLPQKLYCIIGRHEDMDSKYLNELENANQAMVLARKTSDKMAFEAARRRCLEVSTPELHGFFTNQTLEIIDTTGSKKGQS